MTLKKKQNKRKQNNITFIIQSNLKHNHLASAVSAHGAKGAVNRQKVNVTVIAAQSLLAADIGGKSDPFVQLIVRNRGSLKQTSTKQKTTNPAWNEEFELYVTLFIQTSFVRCSILIARFLCFLKKKKKNDKKFQNSFFFFSQ
jgi:Ca2+-dependent lipid-binding protein